MTLPTLPPGMVPFRDALDLREGEYAELMAETVFDEDFYHDDYLHYVDERTLYNLHTMPWSSIIRKLIWFCVTQAQPDSEVEICTDVTDFDQYFRMWDNILHKPISAFIRKRQDDCNLTYWTLLDLHVEKMMRIHDNMTT